MKLYIRATGNISPQNTFGRSSLPGMLAEYESHRLKCIEPDYTKLIDVKLIRRMSRIIRMGVAAALDCLKQGNVENPDAIITGTAYGCLDDTGIFLQKMVQNREEMLTPTAFIQSTHNTIGAQIALLLKCHGYNNTFVHRGFSFESAVLDAMMLLEENQVTNVLVGAVDEITDFSFAIMKRFGVYKKASSSNLGLFDHPSSGTIAGEGASFFLFCRDASPEDYASLEAMETFYKPADKHDVLQRISTFLSQHAMSVGDIDIVLLGRSGDQKTDQVYDEVEAEFFSESAVVNYKHLCGEYPTSTGFALWLAVGIIKNNQLPEVFNRDVKKDIRRVLIYSHHHMIHHSIMLVAAC